MTKRKFSKPALFASAAALILCFSIFLGTTFAWFTDSVSSGCSIIQAGNLDIQLLDANGEDLEGQVLEFIDMDDNPYWEPGCTYRLEPITVKNSGTLALKYKILISGINGSAKLNKVIDWTMNGNPIDPDEEYTLAPGETNSFDIQGHMLKTAGNEYQGLKIEGISLTVTATQKDAESDSMGNDYDAKAEYDFVSSVIAANHVVSALPADSVDAYVNGTLREQINILKQVGIITDDTSDVYAQRVVAGMDLKDLVLCQGEHMELNLTKLSSNVASLELEYLSGVEQPVSIHDGTTLYIGVGVETGTGVYKLTYKDRNGQIISQDTLNFHAVKVHGHYGDLATVAVGETVTVQTDATVGMNIVDYPVAKDAAEITLVTRHGYVTINRFTINEDGTVTVNLTRTEAGVDNLRFVIRYADGTTQYNNIGKIR